MSPKRWWLSFADSSLPKGSQFLGVAVVRGADLGEAVIRAWATGCNPGGEVMALEFPDDMGPVWEPIFAATPLDTLMDKPTLVRLGHGIQSLDELPEETVNALLTPAPH